MFPWPTTTLVVIFSLLLVRCSARLFPSTQEFQVSGSPLLIEPDRFYCNDQHPLNMEVVPAPVSFPNLLSFNSRLYSINNSLPRPFGPTIIVQPGQSCFISFTNKLYPPIRSCSKEPPTNNTFSCPETTNLHTHGLHVSPDQDNVLLEINPGETRDFRFAIPSGHLMGTHWYHAHHHRSTALHVQGGQAGVLLVEPSKDSNLPLDLKQLYDLHSRVMILQHWLFANENSTNKNQCFGLLGYPDLWGRTQSQTPYQLNASIIESDFYTVNGQFTPVVHLQPGVTMLMRLVHATGLRLIELSMVNPDVGQCSWKILARDGIFLESPLAVDLIVLFPGSRADVAVICQTGGSTMNVTAGPNTELDGFICSSSNCCSSRHEQATVWSFFVDTVSPQDEVPVPLSLVPEQDFPKYLQNLIGKSEIRPLEVRYGISNDTISFGGGGLYVNGMKFNETNPLSELTQDAVYWVWLKPPPSGLSHPYHQHVVPFQLDLEQDLLGGVLARKGEWRDTFPQMSALSLDIPVKLVFSPQSFSGMMIMHCHIFEHEDQGMMAFFSIQSSACFVPIWLSLCFTLMSFLILIF